MIACEKCGVANMADSRFCRACGAEMPPPPARPMTYDDQKMVHDAQRLFSESRYDEAALVATAILDENPYCVQALAIKGDCHERLGEYSQALACYRDILKLEPDSQLDRIRVARLEKIVSSGEIEIGPVTGKRRTALGAAVAAAVLLVSSGSALILAARSPETTSQKPATDHQSEPFLPIARVPGGNYYTPNQQDAPQGELDDLGGVDTMGAGRVTPLLRPGDSQRIAPGAIPRNPSNVLDPNQSTTVDPNDTNVRPVNPMGGNGQRQSPPGSGFGDPDPTVVNNRGDDGKGSVVDIRPTENRGTGTSNVTADDRAARIDTLIRVAREKYVIGDYARAADAYEKALALGATPSTTNQRLAQCYERLGKKADAIAAYERAIKAFEQLDQNDERVRSSLEVCRTALNLLRGN